MEERIRAFFEFVFDRQQVWHRRSRLCLPAPWSDDDILRNYRFCNVYRELDGGTQAIVKYLKPDISPEQKLFNIVAYRFSIAEIPLKICLAVCLRLKILILSFWSNGLTKRKSINRFSLMLT